ncbi:MAG: tetratricopeptide repeat protein [Armatimonadetes bacterium]|nr:tetratricopeptide repeat protein [Armatimonadota bacterium]
MRPDFSLIKELFDLAGSEGPPAEPSPVRGKKGKNSHESGELGRQALTEGDYEAAIEHFKAAVEQSDEKSPWPLMDLGHAYATMDLVPQALRQYVKAKRIQISGELMISLAALYRQFGRHSEAIEQLKESVRLEPDNAYNHYKLAEALRKAGYNSAALDAAQVAVACAPDQSFYHYWLGEFFLDTQKYSEAIDALHAAIELAPGDDQLFYLAALAFWGAGKHQEALRSVRLASDINPASMLYHGLLEVMLRGCGLNEEAALETKKAAKMDPYDRQTLKKATRHLGISAS